MYLSCVAEPVQFELDPAPDPGSDLVQKRVRSPSDPKDRIRIRIRVIWNWIRIHVSKKRPDPALQHCIYQIYLVEVISSIYLLVFKRTNLIFITDFFF